MVVDVATGRPGSALAPYVERDVGSRPSGFAPGIHRGMPSRRLALIISLGAPAEIVAGPNGGGSTTAQAFVGRLHTRAAPTFAGRPIGVTSSYLVTDHPDDLHSRAIAAGAEIVDDLHDTDDGSRGFTVRDPEGNLWSIGTYRGAVLDPEAAAP